MPRIRKSLNSTIRILSDVSIIEGKSNSDRTLCSQLLPGAALRMVHHHFHASGIVPRRRQMFIDVKGRLEMYDHDWVCVNEAVTCYPLDGHVLLGHCLLREDHSPTNSPNHEEDSIQTHLWIDHVGQSSIQVTHVVATRDHILLATVHRVLVRRTQGGKSTPFTSIEHLRLENIGGIDKELVCRLYAANSGLKALSLTSFLPPVLQQFGTFLPRCRGVSSSEHAILSVQVGPQHMSGRHADYSFLLETAIQALTLAKLPPSTSVAATYLSPARLGQKLDCVLHDDRVYVVQRDSHAAVLVAKARPTQ